MKPFKIIPIIAILVCCACAVSVYYLGCTPGGAAFVLNRALSHTDYVQSYGYKQIEGSLLQGLSIRQLVLKGLRDFPEGSECRLSRLDLGLSSVLPPFNPEVVFSEGRLFLQGSEPVSFEGRYDSGEIRARVEARRMNIESLGEFFAQLSAQARSVSGTLTGADIVLSGPPDELLLKGSLIIEECRYRLFRLRQIPLLFDLVVRKTGDRELVFGTVSITGGTFSGKKTAPLLLRESSILFDGEPSLAQLDITAGAQVDEVVITARLRGPMERPEFSLSSEPPLSREELLLILATGYSFRDVVDSVKRDGGIVDKLKDFFTYEEQYITP
ncbi:MAG: translocation/assembly module TamB [Candidatus Omnitrophica bacterium]|nr:translocation/assembly module TamB [Candidatus Omnitrophota bacterium]